MQTIFNLLSPSYLFHRSLGPSSSNLIWVFVGILVFLMIASYFYFRLAKTKDIFIKKAAIKFVSLFWTMGIMGIILVLLRQINTVYISAPILLLIWLLIAIIWLLIILKYRFKTVPKRRKDLMQESGKRSYLP